MELGSRDSGLEGEEGAGLWTAWEGSWRAQAQHGPAGSALGLCRLGPHSHLILKSLKTTNTRAGQREGTWRAAADPLRSGRLMSTCTLLAPSGSGFRAGT